MPKNYPMFLILLSIPLFLSAQNIPADTIWNQFDQSGKKYGWWKKYYPDGTLMYKGFFANDSPRGTLIRYFENGEKKAIMHFSDNGKSSYSTLFYMNGEIAAEGKYEETLKDSTWKYYSYYSHTLSYVENYKTGQKSGPSMKYYDNGLVAEIIDWDSNVKQGKWLQYFEDGSLRLSSSFANDKIDGPYKVYTSPGKVAIDGNYKEGNMDGKWTFFNDQGIIKYELLYDNGKTLNDSLLEEKSKEFIKELEKNLGTIPEPDLENFVPEGN
jgi:antitoxin component YwqK of YwqJK toxin-antitoxin module